MNKALVQSYLRNAIFAVLGAIIVVMNVKHYGSPLDLTASDFEAVANALWTGALPTLVRYINKNDKAFGRGSK